MNLEKEFRFRFVLQTEKETYEQQFNLKKTMVIYILHI